MGICGVALWQIQFVSLGPNYRHKGEVNLYYVYFWTNVLGKGMNPGSRLNSTTAVLQG